jgi:hypothetical protein
LTKDSPRRLSRRELVRDSTLAAGALVLPAEAFASDEPAHVSRAPRFTDGPYGPLGSPDPVTGIRVPQGFKVRQIARSRTSVGLTGYNWPDRPDGSGSFPQPDGSWIFVANSEVGGGGGGVSAIHFSKTGAILDAYRICGGTDTNCGGGTTPWGTWLTGEEVGRGRVLECDPKGANGPVARPALGLFSHEYILVHERQKKLYLTEDEKGGGFYRFTPRSWGDLSAGLLEIATLQPDGRVSWSEVPDPSGASVNTREQVPGVSNLKKPEGLCIDRTSGVVFFAESGAGRVYAYDPASDLYELLYNEHDYANPILTESDNLAVSPLSGDLFICEDSGSFDICILTPEGEMAKFVNLSGIQHEESFIGDASETTGPSFDPSGTRFFFSSQRAFPAGATYEVTGPWRQRPDVRFGPEGPKGGEQEPEIRPEPQEVKLSVPRLIRRRRLAERGLPVTITLDTRSSVALELRARTLRGRRIVLAKLERDGVRPRRVKFVLKPRRGVRKLKRRMKLVATVTEDVGRSATVKRRIRFRRA